jgi:hypothetical protein
LQIDSLVLEGIACVHRDRVVEAMRIELGELISANIARLRGQDSRSTDEVSAGEFRPGRHPEQTGRALAGAIFQALKGEA